MYINDYGKAYCLEITEVENDKLTKIWSQNKIPLPDFEGSYFVRFSTYYHGQEISYFCINPCEHNRYLLYIYNRKGKVWRCHADLEKVEKELERFYNEWE